MINGQKDLKKNQGKSQHEHFNRPEKQGKASNNTVAMVALMEIVCSVNFRPLRVEIKCPDGVEKFFEKIKYFFIIYFLILSLHIFYYYFHIFLFIFCFCYCNFKKLRIFDDESIFLWVRQVTIRSKAKNLIKINMISMFK